MDKQQGLAARSALGQPRLDVEPALGQLDIVLTDGPAARRRQFIYELWAFLGKRKQHAL